MLVTIFGFFAGLSQILLVIAMLAIVGLVIHGIFDALFDRR